MKHTLLSLLGSLSLIYTCQGFSAEKPAQDEAEHAHFTREEVDHKFGTAAGKQIYPEQAIDTDASPNVAFAADTPVSEPLKTYEIIPGTHFIYGNIAEVDENNRGFNGNAGFVITDDGVVVIDALGSPKLGQRIINTVKQHTDKPIKYLIVTHNHPDHAYGAIAFKALDGLTVLGHEGTLEYINSGRIEHSLAYRETFIKDDMQGFQPVEPDIMVGGDLYNKNSISVGGKTFDIYNTGAHHSFGDLIVHQVDDNIVWISDLAFNNRVTFMADGHSQAAIDAQTWLLETFKDARFMVPGHGSVQTAPFPMVTRTRDYMQRLRNDMAKAIAEDADLQTAVDNSEFEDWQDVNMYRLNHKKNIDFVYREMELESF